MISYYKYTLGGGGPKVENDNSQGKICKASPDSCAPKINPKYGAYMGRGASGTQAGYLPFCTHGRMATMDTITLKISVELMKNLLREQLCNCMYNVQCTCMYV